ncbi:MAG: hypothetical protein ACLUKE_17525 [Blautia wexlerae]
MAENALLERAVNLILQNEKTEKTLVEKILRVLELNASQNLTMVHMHGKDYESECAANTLAPNQSVAS